MDRARLANIRPLRAQSAGKFAMQPESSTAPRVVGSSANFSRAQQNEKLSAVIVRVRAVGGVGGGGQRESGVEPKFF